MEHVPLWTFLGSISQIMSRFTFETSCFLDNLVLRLATEYPSIVIYPFQLSYECFKERNLNVKFERPLIRQISNKIGETGIHLQKFIDSLKVLNLPEIVLKSCLGVFLKGETNSKLNQQRLKAGYDDVFKNPMRGQLRDKIQSLQKDFDELMNMIGMFSYYLFPIIIV